MPGTVQDAGNTKVYKTLSLPWYAHIPIEEQACRQPIGVKTGVCWWLEQHIGGTPLSISLGKYTP
jgi:hypothetical protein